MDQGPHHVQSALVAGKPVSRKLAGCLPVQLRDLDEEDNCLYTGGVGYEWDPAKAAANLEMHGVSFAEASTVFLDDFALTREDPQASGEQRLVTLGLSDEGNLLVVVYTVRQPDILRIISAWKANRRQRLKYEKSRR